MKEQTLPNRESAYLLVTDPTVFDSGETGQAAILGYLKGNQPHYTISKIILNNQEKIEGRASEESIIKALQEVYKAGSLKTQGEDYSFPEAFWEALRDHNTKTETRRLFDLVLSDEVIKELGREVDETKRKKELIKSFEDMTDYDKSKNRDNPYYLIAVLDTINDNFNTENQVELFNTVFKELFICQH